MTERTRRQLRTVSTGLVVYGLVGIVLTVILLGVSLTIGSRLETLSDSLSIRLERLATTVDTTATTLEAAASTSGGASSTLDHAVTAVGQVETTLGSVAAAVGELQTTASTLSILGQTPLTSLADRLGTIAGELGTLQGTVGSLGDDLATNQTNLNALGASLGDLGAQLRQVSAQLRSGDIEASLHEVVGVVRLTLGLLAAWFAVPAVAALVFGVWLRRELAAEPPTNRPPPEAGPG